MADGGNSEFDLHIWKQRAEGERTDRYTVGVWKQGRIMPLCHIQPLDNTIAVIRRALVQAGSVCTPAPAPKNRSRILSSLRRVIS
jgi:hypothetical protein